MKQPQIRIAPELEPPPAPEPVFIHVNRTSDWQEAFEALPAHKDDDLAGFRAMLLRRSEGGVPRVLIVARRTSADGKRTGCAILGAHQGVGIDGRKTLLVDLLLGTADLDVLKPLVAYLGDVARNYGLASLAQVSGALVPSRELLLAAGFTTYSWLGYEVLELK